MKTHSNFHVRALIHCLQTRRLCWALPVLVGVLLAALPMAARRAGASAAQLGAEAFWETVEPAGNAPRVFRLREAAMRAALQQAGLERAAAPASAPVVIAWPLPDGSFARFSVVEAPVLSAELAAQYPALKSYRGQGLDNPRLAFWCSWTPQGLRVWLRDGAETVRIQPLADTPPNTPSNTSLGTSSGISANIAGDNEASFPLDYVSLAEQITAEQAQDAVCLVQASQLALAHTRQASAPRAVNASVGPTLRTYRLALAATTQFKQTYGGGTAGGTNTTFTTLFDMTTGVNAIYGSELAIQFTLVTNDDLIGNPAPPVPIANGDAMKMVDSGRALFKAKLPETTPATKYDLGLILGTGTGGTAYIGVVCENAADTYGPYKGGAAVLINGSLTDVNNKANMVRLIAHEIGHQFGAQHTQNADCAGSGRFGDTAVEPGNGVSLMSNPGSCAGNDIAAVREPFFHAVSFTQINQYLGSAAGADCATISNTNNSAPVITSKTANTTIPKGTPFTLTAMATDANGDSLTYAWEQVDAGGADFANPPYTDVNDLVTPTTIVTRPLFRPFTPKSSGSRNFPDFTYVPPANLLAGESLPQVARTLNFMVTVRDNRVAGGGVSNDTIQLTVDGNGLPFQVNDSSVPGNWVRGTSATITWQKGNTDIAPINCANVKITLLTNGGNTVLATTPNTGSASVTLPFDAPASTTARIKIEGIGNIFFDISDTDFTIPATCGYALAPVSQYFTTAGGMGMVTVSTSSGCTWTVSGNPAWVTINSGASGTGPGTVTVTYTVTANTPSATNTGAVRNAVLTIGNQAFPISQQADPAKALVVKADFDGDHKTDLSVWTPSTGNWSVLNSGNSQVQTIQWGAGYAPFNDVIVPGDYDGDKKVDHAIWRGADSIWYIRKSSDGQAILQLYGTSNAPYFDLPTPGDFDGDGKTDLAVFRPSTGTWYVRRSSNNTDLIVQHGQNGDMPVAADYDGDGKTDFAVFRPSAIAPAPNWFILQSTNNQIVSFQWGAGYAPFNDSPVPADYDGDGKADLAIWRGADSIWYIRPSATPNAPKNQLYGTSNAPYFDTPVPGDYDGDGRADIAVWRKDGTWFVLRSSDNMNIIQTHGQSNDVPCPATGIR